MADPESIRVVSTGADQLWLVETSYDTADQITTAT